MMREGQPRALLAGRDRNGVERPPGLLPAPRNVAEAPLRGQSEELRGILRRALQVRGMARKLRRIVSPELWESAVGRQLAARAQPTVLSAGTLHLLVEDHRWRDQLDAARVFLIERLNQRLGKGSVRRLQFGLAHAGLLDHGRRRAALCEEAREPRAAVAPGLLGAARLEAGLREALLRAAEAAAQRASTAIGAAPAAAAMRQDG
jgi:hypothetical protein